MKLPLDEVVWICVGIACVAGGIAFIPIVLYYFISFFRIKKRAKRAKILTGTVTNFECGLTWPMASITISVEEQKYSTPAYVLKSEAQDLMGESVRFCVVKGKPYIFDVIS